MSLIFEAAELICTAGGIRRAAVVNLGGDKKSVRKLHLMECSSKEVVVLEQIGRSFRSLAKKSGGFRSMLQFYRDKASVRMIPAPF